MLSQNQLGQAALIVFGVGFLVVGLVLFFINYEPAPKVYPSTPTSIPAREPIEKTEYERVEETQRILDQLDFTEVFRKFK